MEFPQIITIWLSILADPLSLINCRREISEAIKVLILVPATALPVLWPRLSTRLRKIALVTLVVVSTINYGRWGTELVGIKVDVYDLSHYYLNAKYFDELGYYDLYPAVIVADHEHGGPYFKEGNRYMDQDDDGHRLRPISQALSTGRKVRDTRFSPERWSQFCHDALYLQRTVPGFTDILWRQMIQDHGYNGTPAWTLLARPIAAITPVEKVKFLGYLDLLLLLAAIGFTYWAFGFQTAAFLWIFLMTSYSMRWPALTWSFLRCDYLALLVIALALLKKGHPFLAGLASGYSAAMRLFPALWMIFPALKGLFALTRGRLNLRLVALALGFTIATAALVGQAATSLGPEQISIHFDNMMDHNKSERLSSRRIGLALALPYHPGQEVPHNIEPERKKVVEKQKPLRYAIAIALMTAMAWGLRRSSEYENFGYGFVPFFLLTTASYYYYAARSTLVVLHAGALDILRNRVGLSFMFGLELMSNWMEAVYPEQRVLLIGSLSWGLAFYTLMMVLLLNWSGIRRLTRWGTVGKVSPATPSRQN